MWKHIRFQLRFDDPRLLSENHVVIQGDRIQLEKLADAVGDYVQRFLHATPSRPVVLDGLGTATTDPSAVHVRAADASDSASFNYLEHLHHIQSTSWADMARLALATSVVDSADLTGSAESSDDHANQVNGAAQVNAIAPERQPSELGERFPAPATNGTVSTSHARDIFLEPEGLLHHRLQLGPLATAQSGDALVLNTTQLFDLATALDDYRTAGLAIPTLNQQRWVQRPSSWGKIAAGVLIALALTPAIANIWEGSTVISEAPTNSENATSLDQQQQTVARIDSNTIMEGDAPIDPNALETLPPPPPAGAVQPNAPATLPRVPVTSSPRAVQRPVVPPPLPGTVTPSAPSTSSSPSDTPSAAPAPAGTVELEIAPQPESSTNQTADSATSIASAEADSAEPESSTLSAESAESARSETPAKTAFDTLPQVAQVRQYFQARWAPPESLEDTLEYRLTLAPDGSLEEVTPLGQASEIYLDRTSIPLRGESFISPSPDGNAARIRLVLSPNGAVQTFAE